MGSQLGALLKYFRLRSAEYLRNGLRYRQAENGVIIYNPSDVLTIQIQKVAQNSVHFG